jgi:hypothetical protein
MMASDEGNPSPSPVPVARPPKLPSNAEIDRPCNADMSGQRRVRSSPAAGATAIDESMQTSAPTNDGDDYTTRAADDSASRRMVIPPCCRLILAYDSYYKYLNELFCKFDYLYFLRRESERRESHAGAMASSPPPALPRRTPSRRINGDGQRQRGGSGWGRPSSQQLGS